VVLGEGHKPLGALIPPSFGIASDAVVAAIDGGIILSRIEGLRDIWVAEHLEPGVEGG
jgi:hypothetical protein